MTHERRAFLGAVGGLGVAGTVLGARAEALELGTHLEALPFSRQEGDEHRGRCCIASGNGLPAVTRAMEGISQGADPADACVEGVQIVELDPDDVTVGYGGLPNEDGVVQLDASVMHGPTHKAGAVAAIEGIRTPAAVALQVLKRTDHVLLVGAGAKKFALRLGFKEEELLTDRAREAWLRWKSRLNPNDDWLDPGQSDFDEARRGANAAPRGDLEFKDGVPHTWGTINCSATTDDGDVASCTTTSGLSWKLPGRVGDSPIIGAGMYCDNAVGAAGATGRGEAVIQNCGAFSIVRHMEAGLTPTEACLETLRAIARNTRQKRLLDNEKRPNFQVVLYAVRKDGAFGSASMWSGSRFAVHNGDSARLLQSASLYRR